MGYQEYIIRSNKRSAEECAAFLTNQINNKKLNLEVVGTTKLKENLSASKITFLGKPMDIDPINLKADDEFVILAGERTNYNLNRIFPLFERAKVDFYPADHIMLSENIIGREWDEIFADNLKEEKNINQSEVPAQNETILDTSTSPDIRNFSELDTLGNFLVGKSFTREFFIQPNASNEYYEKPEKIIEEHTIRSYNPITKEIDMNFAEGDITTVLDEISSGRMIFEKSVIDFINNHSPEEVIPRNNDLIDTNIGKIPKDELNDILAIQNGFDSYEEMKAAGLYIDNDISPVQANEKYVSSFDILDAPSAEDIKEDMKHSEDMKAFSEKIEAEVKAILSKDINLLTATDLETFAENEVMLRNQYTIYENGQPISIRINANMQDLKYQTSAGEYDPIDLLKQIKDADQLQVDQSYSPSGSLVSRMMESENSLLPDTDYSIEI